MLSEPRRPQAVGTVPKTPWPLLHGVLTNRRGTGRTRWLGCCAQRKLAVGECTGRPESPLWFAPGPFPLGALSLPSRHVRCPQPVPGLVGGPLGAVHSRARFRNTLNSPWGVSGVTL